MSYFTFSNTWPFGIGVVLAAWAESEALFAGGCCCAVDDVLELLALDEFRFAQPSRATSATGITSV